ncbi:MmcQ/YjbR family DNA-binding protein [Glycomyces harbinensis]|uniref:Predicted DNA-binding protein, MmcQ/YjbR family n=1 Tax=Glycomyces harbinensis TaxID=58114 RepID=A0A1G6QXB9_9ACTN|nr:MmcQ/YjbR family DNA-binding protein [Glycomyces harbinensis]SDC96634.1 Predicted DNA-binding protein, MmcQ/YjbR family [Glycomyces harbinensis]
MDGETLLKVAAEAAEEQSGAVLEHPFGPDTDVYKVGGKIFLLLADVKGVAMATLKADPTEAIALREQYAQITPGYHVNKRLWISVTAGGEITRELVADLVRDAHGIVRDALPKRLRLKFDGSL